jgi:hypothetical protein
MGNLIDSLRCFWVSGLLLLMGQAVIAQAPVVSNPPGRPAELGIAVQSIPFLPLDQRGLSHSEPWCYGPHWPSIPQARYEHRPESRFREYAP